MTGGVAGAAETRAGMLLRLEDAHDPHVAGGKASALARMLRAGVSVPAGVVLTVDAFAQMLETSALESTVRARVAGTDPADPEALERTAAAIRTDILRTALPASLEVELHAAAADLLRGRGALAVRSSAVGEDGAAASFAGQFDSVLHVDSVERLCDAVRHCWASCWSARAMFYRHRRAMPAGPMAVIIQQQVRAAAAGVLFTRDPQGREDAMVVEWVAGLADRLVSGEVTPNRALLSRTTGAHLPGGVADGDAPPLTTRQWQQLHAVATRLEILFGGPQDVEWAIDAEGRLALVQSRPITVLPATTSSEHATRPAPATRPSVIWSNANINENFPEPVSPLLYSIACDGYRHYFRNLGVAFGISRRRLAAMDPHFRTIIGAHGARLYYNLTNIHAVLQMAPFGDRLAAAFNLFVGADRIAALPASASTWRDVSRARQVLALLRIIAAVAWQFAWLPARLRRFERTADTFARDTAHEALKDASLDTLGARLITFVGIRCHRWKNASLCDTAAMVTYAWLRHALARRGYGDATHTKLLRALPNVPSSRPAVHLWDLSRQVRADADLLALLHTAPLQIVLARVRSEPQFAAFRTALDAYLRDWGFRSSGELMLTVPTLEESPAAVLELLRSYADADGDDPAAAMREQASERRGETRRILAGVGRRAPWAAAYLWLLIRLTQGAIACRERARLKQALLYTRLRRVALTIGDALVRERRLSRREDVFMLTWREIEEVCAGRAMVPYGIDAAVRLRRAQHAEAAALAPPDTFELPAGAGWRRPSGRSSSDVRAESAGPDATALTGAIACGGTVTAPAAVLASVSDISRLRQGDVLVTRQTDPGWAPVFPLVTGLVIERGGMLSHGAIIAREFGLPCLVGVKGATTLIPHGAMVTIDAETSSGSSLGHARIAANQGCEGDTPPARVAAHAHVAAEAQA